MGKIRIDLDRHLCGTCKFLNKCDFDGFETGENDNVIRCKKYNKANANKLKQRAELGDTYYVFGYVDEKNLNFSLTPKQRVESNTRIEDLFHEIGNYFISEQKCIEAIKLIESKK